MPFSLLRDLSPSGTCSDFVFERFFNLTSAPKSLSMKFRDPIFKTAAGRAAPGIEAAAPSGGAAGQADG
jgi:hypothetical protein